MRGFGRVRFCARSAAESVAPEGDLDPFGDLQEAGSESPLLPASQPMSFPVSQSRFDDMIVLRCSCRRGNPALRAAKSAAGESPPETNSTIWAERRRLPHPKRLNASCRQRLDCVSVHRHTNLRSDDNIRTKAAVEANGLTMDGSAGQIETYCRKRLLPSVTLNQRSL